MNIIVLLAILVLALLAGWLLVGEAFRNAQDRIRFDVRRQEDEHPRRRLRRIK